MFAFLKTIIVQRNALPNSNQASAASVRMAHPRRVTPINSVILEADEYSQRCSICNERISARRADGTTEYEAMLPCGHSFGSICISQWLDQHSLHKDCPNCRRRIVYQACGHPIRPRGVERAPTPVAEKEMPENCVMCRDDGGGSLGAQLRAIRGRMVAEEKALEGLKVLPGLFAGVARPVSDIDIRRRMEESKNFWRNEMERLSTQLEYVREGW